MSRDTTPLQRAFVTLNPKLELVSYTDEISLWAPLTVDDALKLAQELCLTTAKQQPALGTPKAGEVQDALSQAWAWLQNAQAALAAARALTPPTSTLTN